MGVIRTLGKGVGRRMFRDMQYLLPLLKYLVSWFLCSGTDNDFVCVTNSGCNLTTYHQLTTSILNLLKQRELVSFFPQQHHIRGAVADL